MKKVAVLLTIFFMSISLVSCASKPKDSNTKELKGKVSLWTIDSNEALINDAVALFKKKNPSVEVNVSSLDFDKVTEALSKNSSEKVNLPDMIVVRDKDVPIIINEYQNSFLESSSIPQFNKDVFIKNQINNATYKNKIYAVPWYVEPTFMIYREDILESLNIKSEDIKTWKQYMDIGSNQVKASGKFMLSSDYFNSGTVYDLALNQLGVDYFNKDKKIDLLSQKSVKAAGLLNDIYNSKILDDDSESSSKIQSFVSGSTVSLIGNLSTIYNIQKQYSSLKSKLKIEKIPAFEPGGNRDTINFGDNLMLLKSSSNNPAALEFTRFLSSDTELSTYEFARYGVMSSDTTSYGDDSFYKKNSFYNNQSLGRMAIDEVSALRTMTYNHNFNDIRNKTVQIIIDASKNNKPLNESMYNLQTNLEQPDSLK
jgi:multiple sugar transport system substrate-binding protein